MNTIVILGGAGNMSQTTIKDLITYSKDIKIIIADRNVAAAEKRVKELASDRVSARYVDLNNEKSIKAVIKNVDLVMNCALSKYNIPVMKAALSTNTHYMDLSALPQNTLEQMKLDEEFRKAKLLAIIGMGAAPGISNLMAKFAYDRLDKVESVKFRIASISMVESTLPIRFPYSAYALLGQIEYRTMIIEDGKLKEVDSLTGAEFTEFPDPIGTVETIYLSHPEPAMLSKTFMEKGLKFSDVKLYYTHPEFIEKLKFIRDLGFVNSKPTKVGDVEIIPREVIAHFILQLPTENLEPNDIVCFVVRVLGERDGKRLEYVLRHTGLSRDGLSSLSVDTGIPIAIAAHMMFKEGFPKRGALTPEACIDPQPFFKELAKRNLYVSYHVNEFVS
jgi:saccharopine dehydrogenase-like NADP-dependent oxidoreductase